MFRPFKAKTFTSDFLIESNNENLMLTTIHDCSKAKAPQQSHNNEIYAGYFKNFRC